jgi:DNA-binding GntR family transcriptional regulator
MDSICNEFNGIIGALKEKDSARSKEMLESHVRNSFEFIKKRF